MKKTIFNLILKKGVFSLSICTNYFIRVLKNILPIALVKFSAGTNRRKNIVSDKQVKLRRSEVIKIKKLVNLFTI